MGFYGDIYISTYKKDVNEVSIHGQSYNGGNIHSFKGNKKECLNFIEGSYHLTVNLDSDRIGKAIQILDKQWIKGTKYYIHFSFGVLREQDYYTIAKR